jgi:hypothetical protein
MGIFLTGRVVSFGEERGPAGKGRACRGLRQRQPCRRGKGRKGFQRAVEQAAGDERAFIPLVFFTLQSS